MSRFWNNDDQRHFQPLSGCRIRSLFYFGGGGDTDIKDTEDGKAYAEVAVNTYKDYRDTYYDAENEFFADVDDLNSKEDQKQVSNLANSGTQSAYADATKESLDTMTEHGVNAGSGDFNNAIGKAATETAKAGASNTSQSQQALQDQYVGGLSNIVSMGQGQATEAIQGMSSISQAANDKAISDANSNFVTNSANKAAAGTAAGIAAGIYTNSDQEE